MSSTPRYRQRQTSRFSSLQNQQEVFLSFKRSFFYLFFRTKDELTPTLLPHTNLYFKQLYPIFEIHPCTGAGEEEISIHLIFLHALEIQYLLIRLIRKFHQHSDYKMVVGQWLVHKARLLSNRSQLGKNVPFYN